MVSVRSTFVLIAAFCGVAFAQQYCPNNWHGLMSAPGTCVLLSREKTTWIDAHNWCTLFGGELLQEGPAMMYMQLAQLITARQTGKYWIGLTDMEVEGSYKWSSSGRPASFMAFKPGQSAGGNAKNCVHIDEKGLMGVESCKAEFWFVCQRRLQRV